MQAVMCVICASYAVSVITVQPLYGRDDMYLNALLYNFRVLP